jgi:hypothetical protein
VRLFGDLARLRLREPGCGLLSHQGKCTYLDTPVASRRQARRIAKACQTAWYTAGI